MNLINFLPNAYACCGTFIQCFIQKQFIGFQTLINLETQRLCHLVKYGGVQLKLDGNNSSVTCFLNLRMLFLFGFGECTNRKQLMGGHSVLGL